MKSFILLALFVTVVTAHPLENSLLTTIEELNVNFSTSRIISGRRAVPGQFPHQVLNLHVKGNDMYMCGGSLICDSWVLTAAHCADGVSSFTLYFGSIDRELSSEPGRVVVKRSQAIVHPRYNPDTLENDVALIYLGERLSFTDKIRPIPLKITTVPERVRLTVSGWGRTSDASSATSRYLNYVEIDSISNPDCKRFYRPDLIVDSTLCCKGRPEHSSCNGDSGGPLIQYVNNRAVLVGVVSFVPISGCSIGGPSGYARISYYMDWIEKNIGGSCQITKV